MRSRISAEIIENTALTDDIYSMWLDAPDIAEVTEPGQFIAVYTKDCSKLLPRPISICETDKARGAVRIVYKLAGEGTKGFSKLPKGESLLINGPLGNGYDVEELIEKYERILLVGGGVGIPPMLSLAKELTFYSQKYNVNREIIAVIGFRDKNTFLTEELSKYAGLVIASDNGEVGHKGNVIDAIKAEELAFDVACACGPKPMLKGLISYTRSLGIKTYVSLEERMACGIGACLACVCKTKDTDDHSKVKNARICKDGPVFDAEEIVL